MLGMGVGELIVVFIVILLVVGPEKIPETARVLGRWFYELKRSVDEVRDTFQEEMKGPLSSKARKSESPVSNSSSEVALQNLPTVQTVDTEVVAPVLTEPALTHQSTARAEGGHVQ